MIEVWYKGKWMMTYYDDGSLAVNDEFEKDIENRLELSIKLERDAGTPPLLTRLRTKGLLMPTEHKLSII